MAGLAVTRFHLPDRADDSLSAFGRRYLERQTGEGGGWANPVAQKLESVALALALVLL
jgi:hypothetical protein